MTVTVLHRPPRVASHDPGTRDRGTNMQPSPLLDLLERLLKAAAHPDIVSVERYGPGLGPWGPSVQESKVKAITGIMVRHQSSATASLWEAVWPGEQPVDPPAVMPTPKQNRAPRLLIFANQLLDYAKPEALTSWQLVTLPKLGNPDTQEGLPFGLSVVSAGGKKLLLRATATGPTIGFEPEGEPFPDYIIPEEVKTCLLGSSTTKMSPGRSPVAANAGRGEADR